LSAQRNALRMALVLALVLAHLANGAPSFATVLDFGQRIAPGGDLSCVR
jgi:hypothetical protein